ncbi:glucosyltransferase domain-containing protein [Intestinibacter bartlettii]|uniref:glucosyltransferase domain-containing protein n=1 Tax=Intestinibacter bartlettii TaxID=261299 RepID=UPI0039A05F13
MFNIKPIEQVIQNRVKKISIQFKIAFTSCIIVGLLAHLYMFMNKFPNYDDMAINSFGASLKLGRWFLWVLGAIAYHLDFVYSIPWINGFLTVICIATAAGMLVDMLHVKSKLCCALIGACLVVFPSWTATFFFMFTAPYYGVAFLLAVCSVYIAMKYYGKSKIKWLSPVCLACSLGIYQAYLPFVATCYVTVLLFEILLLEQNWIKSLKKAFYYLIQLLAGGGIYFLVMKISLQITGQSLTSYKGVDKMGVLSKESLLYFWRVIEQDFLGISINNNLEISHNLLLKVMYLLLSIFTILCIVVSIAKSIKRHNYMEAVFEVIYTIALVITINSIYLICQDGVYSLMRYSYVWLIIFPICLLDGMEMTLAERGKFMILLGWGMTLSICAGIFSYVHLANAEYFSMQLTFEQAKSYYTTVITQIKELDGYEPNMPVSFVGYGDIVDESLYRNQIMKVFEISGRDQVLAQTYDMGVFLRYYCGFDVEFFDIDTMQYKEISDMPTYPSEGSVQIIDGNVVVKFSK